MAAQAAATALRGRKEGDRYQESEKDDFTLKGSGGSGCCELSLRNKKTKHHHDHLASGSPVFHRNGLIEIIACCDIGACKMSNVITG